MTPCGFDPAGRPIGWLYKVIVNKHATGFVSKGQIQINGVWGDKDESMRFSQDEECDGKYVWWKEPVYLKQALDRARTETVERCAEILDRYTQQCSEHCDLVGNQSFDYVEQWLSEAKREMLALNPQEEQPRTDAQTERCLAIIRETLKLCSGSSEDYRLGWQLGVELALERVGRDAPNA